MSVGMCGQPNRQQQQQCAPECSALKCTQHNATHKQSTPHLVSLARSCNCIFPRPSLWYVRQSVGRSVHRFTIIIVSLAADAGWLAGGVGSHGCCCWLGCVMHFCLVQPHAAVQFVCTIRLSCSLSSSFSSSSYRSSVA